MEPEIRNAIICHASISYDDRGCLDCMITLDYGHSQQGFAYGQGIYLPKSFDHHEIKSRAGHYIFRCMEVAGVTDWSKMIGRPIRAKCSDGLIRAIGHIVKDDWFCPREDFKALDEELKNE